MAKFTQIPTDTFQKLQMNAGILLSNFTPSTGEYDDSDIIGATTGGISFEATQEFVDFGEDIDNCPKNTMELKRTDSWECIMSGSFVSMDTTAAKLMVGTGAIDAEDPTKVVPRNSVKVGDFADVWFVGDYSDDNTEETGGFIAIRLINALSTGGFKIQTTDKEKGTFEFEFTGHYSIEEIDTVPFEVYIKGGEQSDEEED